MAREYRNLIEMLKLSPANRYSEYHEVGIDKVKINGKEFGDYSAYRFIWEKSYETEPKRTLNGSMPDIENITTFLVGHLYLDFNFISIDEYREIMKMHYAQNEFIVECRDIIYHEKQKPIKLKMYMATEEVAKLYTFANTLYGDEDNVELWGVQDYTLELIGTNNTLDTIDVKYYLNSPRENDLPIVLGEPDVTIGDEIIIGNSAGDIVSETFGGTYKFLSWNTMPDGSGTPYYNGKAYTITSDLYLYAQWESNTNYTLALAWGEVTPAIDSAGQYINSLNVSYGSAITLPTTPTTRDVEYKKGEDENGNAIMETAQNVYYNGAWYKTPIKQSDMLVPNGTLYWQQRNDTIYLLYDVQTYVVSYDMGGADFTINSQSIAYNQNINVPTLNRSGYKFLGWYVKDTDTTAPAVMPPYNLTLEARWEKI